MIDQASLGSTFPVAYERKQPSPVRRTVEVFVATLYIRGVVHWGAARARLSVFANANRGERTPPADVFWPRIILYVRRGSRAEFACYYALVVATPP
jgi:hypothetical protein